MKIVNCFTYSAYNERKGKWETFDEFKKYNYSLWVISIVYNNLNESTCTCPYFLKHLQCKHVLGMKIRLKLVDVPNETKLIPIDQTLKCGHLAKSKRLSPLFFMLFFVLVFCYVNLHFYLLWHI